MSISDTVPSLYGESAFALSPDIPESGSRIGYADPGERRDLGHAQRVAVNDQDQVLGAVAMPAGAPRGLPQLHNLGPGEIFA